MRFKNLWVNGGRKLKPEIFSCGQKAAILKLEKEEVPGSGNFVSFRLLGDYFDCFNETKEYLIFGNQKVNRSLGFGFCSMWFLVYIIF